VQVLHTCWPHRGATHGGSSSNSSSSTRRRPPMSASCKHHARAVSRVSAAHAARAQVHALQPC
jgi:hypothetical protein